MQVNLKPLITETTMNLAKKGWYTFASDKNETKDTLREVIGRIFKVKVTDIKTIVVKGKNKRSPRSRKIRSLSDWKKVMVKLKEGQKIELFDIGA